MSTQVLNVLTMPLNGIQVIEASAGTGKTYTLAALYVRLVLGHDLARGPLTPPEILVMTFTEAATAELRERIRLRVQVPADDTNVPSLFDVHPGTEAHERETFDMFGITFDGHPDMTRILMPEDWDGHPLRKDYDQGFIPVQFKGSNS